MVLIKPRWSIRSILFISSNRMDRQPLSVSIVYVFTAAALCLLFRCLLDAIKRYLDVYSRGINLLNATQISAWLIPFSLSREQSRYFISDGNLRTNGTLSQIKRGKKKDAIDNRTITHFSFFLKGFDVLFPFNLFFFFFWNAYPDFSAL